MIVYPRFHNRLTNILVPFGSGAISGESRGVRIRFWVVFVLGPWAGATHQSRASPRPWPDTATGPTVDLGARCEASRVVQPYVNNGSCPLFSTI
jgi:hypothetical protein